MTGLKSTRKEERPEWTCTWAQHCQGPMPHAMEVAKPSPDLETWQSLPLVHVQTLIECAKMSNWHERQGPGGMNKPKPDPRALALHMPSQAPLCSLCLSYKLYCTDIRAEGTWLPVCLVTFISLSCTPAFREQQLCLPCHAGKVNKPGSTWKKIRFMPRPGDSHM